MKAKHLLLSALFFVGFSMMSYGQMKVTSAGDVGVGTATPGAKLDVDGNGIFRNQLIRIGTDVGTPGIKIELGEGRNADGPATIDFVADRSSYPDFGVRFARFSNGSSQFQHRGTAGFVFNALDGGRFFFQVSGSNKAFIDNAGFKPGGNGVNTLGSSSNRWSSVWAVNGTIQTSDKRLKKDVKDMPYGIEDIMKLRPVVFKWKENTDAWGNKVGLIAQEVDEVVNEVVYDEEVTIEVDAETGDQSVIKKKAEYIGVNYAELVPVLIKGIQDQQNVIEEQEDRIAALEEKVNKLLEATETREQTAQPSANEATIMDEDAMLKQNVPNPFGDQTLIEYSIPSNATSASLIISTMDGRQIGEYPIDQNGLGQYKLNNSNLQSGIYTYSLIVDGQIISTKKMVVQK